MKQKFEAIIVTLLLFIVCYFIFIIAMQINQLLTMKDFIPWKQVFWKAGPVLIISDITNKPTGECGLRSEVI